MTIGEIIGLISAVIAVWALYVTISKNRHDITQVDVGWKITLEARITALEKKLETMTPINDRVVAVETKVGLFWGIVEEYMVKFVPPGNPIEFTPVEQLAWDTYKHLKTLTSTRDLRIIEYAIERELVEKHNVPADEAFGYVLALTAIKAQLVDRGEAVQKHEYRRPA